MQTKLLVKKEAKFQSYDKAKDCKCVNENQTNRKKNQNHQIVWPIDDDDDDDYSSQPPTITH